MGILSRIKQALAKTKDALAYKLRVLFGGGVLDDEFYDELESILLSSDMGAEATEYLLDRLREEIDDRRIRKREEVTEILKELIVEILTECEVADITPPAVVMISGVNGVGKTTTIGKLARYYQSQGYSVAVAAADTFRAAASDQLNVWAERAKVRIIKQGEGADPAAVVFDAIASVKAKKIDILLVDTAGRLHNKKNLMEELKKISRVIDREYPEAQRVNYVVLDATIGQNSLAQVEIFNEAIELDGIILTKLDGTAKGGVILAIAKELELPVVFVGVGEGIEDLEKFDAQDFAESLM